MEVMAKERPIIFSGDMIRAIIDGRKSVTRRVVKPQPIEGSTLYTMVPRPAYSGSGVVFRGPGGLDARPKEHQRPGLWHCPYGQTGDRLWVREVFAVVRSDATAKESNGSGVLYRADPIFDDMDQQDFGFDWSSPIHMPRWASRLTLEITEVRVEQLQEISKQDAWAEGCPECELCEPPKCGQWGRGAIDDPLSNAAGGRPWQDCWGICEGKTAKEWFQSAWDQINGKTHPWASNPFCWVIAFRRIA